MALHPGSRSLRTHPVLLTLHIRPVTGTCRFCLRNVFGRCLSLSVFVALPELRLRYLLPGRWRGFSPAPPGGGLPPFPSALLKYTLQSKRDPCGAPVAYRRLELLPGIKSTPRRVTLAVSLALEAPDSSRPIRSRPAARGALNTPSYTPLSRQARLSALTHPWTWRTPTLLVGTAGRSVSFPLLPPPPAASGHQANHL